MRHGAQKGEPKGSAVQGALLRRDHHLCLRYYLKYSAHVPILSCLVLSYYRSQAAFFLYNLIKFVLHTSFIHSFILLCTVINKETGYSCSADLQSQSPELINMVNYLTLSLSLSFCSFADHVLVPVPLLHGNYSTLKQSAIPSHACMPLFFLPHSSD